MTHTTMNFQNQKSSPRKSFNGALTRLLHEAFYLDEDTLPESLLDPETNYAFEKEEDHETSAFLQKFMSPFLS